MNKLWKLLGMVAVILVAFSGMAQTINSDLTTKIPKVIPPTPEAASIEKFGVIPVSYSTGIPNIGYPLWSWQRGKLQLNLSLSYHAGGHKVEDMAGSVGLGWALNGLGRVTRTVRGLPDDDVTRGFLYTPVLPQIVSNGYTGGYYLTNIFVSAQQNFPANTAITPLNTVYSDTIRQIAEGWLDGEQDIFSFNCNGASGRFVIDKEKHIVPLEYTNAKIQPVYSSYYNGQPNGNIAYFNITDDKGIIYRFEYQETQTAQSFPVSFSAASPSFNLASGWLMTKIIDPMVNDSIVIQYVANGGTYEGGFGESESWRWAYTDATGNPETPWRPDSDVFTYQGITTNSPVPSQILLPDGAYVTLEHNTSRTDYLNSKALTNVVVKNYQNQVIKNYHFNYSYYTSTGSSPYYPIGFTSGNDFSKRLRLDGIDELSSDGLLSKPTLFSYNSLPLNPRNSMNQDYWGYNVAASRNNLKRAPKLKLLDDDSTYIFGIYLDGADRKPDSIYSKAGVLEKITYPTGGFTSFEYENNRAFSAVDYYEDIRTQAKEWQQAQFGSNSILLLPERAVPKVIFNFKTIEFNPRPTPNPNEPQTCLEGQQDSYNASFEIYSTDNTFTTTITKPYGDFAGGVKQEINLPLNKSYRIRFIYNSSQSCGYMYPFKAVANIEYHIPLQDKLAGGLRIKRIISNDGGGRTTTKQYSYNNSDGLSSASLQIIPNYGYYRSTRDESVSSDGTPTLDLVRLVRVMNRNSNPTTTLNYFNGSPLIYTRVQEIEVDGSLVERQYSSMVSASTGGNGYFPYMPMQDLPALSGLLTKETVKDKLGNLKSEKTVSYTTDVNYMVNQIYNRNVKAGVIATAANYTCTYYAGDQYFMNKSYALESGSETKTYENGTVMTVTQANTYNGWHYPQTMSTTNSTGEQRIVTNYYTCDAVASNPLQSSFLTRNMLGYPVEIKLAEPPETTNGTLGRSITNYGWWNSNTLIAPSSVQRSFKAGALETELTINSYDSKGNILQYTGKDGIVTSFVYGYRQTHSVAKVIGKTYADVISQSSVNLSVLDNPSSDAALRTELNKIRTTAGSLVMVSTYTYKPLVGITSETDANGKTVYYEYDVFNRLKLVRDKDNNIVKRFCYNYTGQLTECTEAMPTFSGPAPQMCTTSSCWQPDRKCINGNCVQGVKYYTATTEVSPGVWECTYRYYWAGDNSYSAYFTETNTAPCLTLEP